MDFLEMEDKTQFWDSKFCQFREMQLGWRAAFLLLHKYINKYRLDTIEKVINRWAPPEENRTDYYINQVCFLSNYRPDEKLSFDDKAQMTLIAAAMCCVENGVQFDPLRKTETLKILYNGYMNAWHEKHK